VRGSHTQESLRRWLAQITTAGIVGSLLTSLWLRSNDADLNRIYFGTDVRAQQILTGALLAVSLPKLKRVINATIIHAMATLICIPVIAVIMLKAKPSSSWLYDGGFLAFSVLALPVVWMCTSHNGWILTRFLSTRPIVAVGRISYGLYLWHWPVHLWLDQESTGLHGLQLLALRIILTFVCTLASWFLFENRIREHGFAKVKPSIRPFVALGTFMALVVSVISVPRLLTPKFTTSTKDGSYSGAYAMSDSYYRSPLRCDAVKAGDVAENWRIVTIGNSLMKEIEPCLQEILSRQGASVEARASNADAICDIQQGLADHPLGDSLANTVIVFFHLPFWNRPCSASIPDEDRDSYYRQALETLIESWIARGAIVLLVPPTPGAEIQTPSPLFDFYESLRAEQPQLIATSDSGKYIRSSDGRYLYSMPCSSVEIGCSADGLIGVRLPVDGQHFCAYPDWQGEPCLLPDAGGERRVATAVAEDIMSTIASKG